MKQTYHCGDLVRTKLVIEDDVDLETWEDLLTEADHSDKWFIIMGSYRDRFGGGQEEKRTYTVLQLHEDGSVNYKWSWLDEEDIDFLAISRCDETMDIIEKYQDEEYEDDEE